MNNYSQSLPLVFSDGIGVDSTAALIGLARAGIRPALILFADTGGEKQETYDYIAVRRAWLKKVGFPDLQIVRYEPQRFKNWPPYYTLEDNCLTNGTLPSLAFGFKSCSLKWKVAPQNKFTEAWAPAADAWRNGGKVQKVIGYDASPADIRRRNHSGTMQDPEYSYHYPLIEWNWDRQRCIEEIKAEGEPVPLKSSCFFCPAMKPDEVAALPPEKLRRIVEMEARAKPRLTTTQGLWRSSTKKRPGSITEFIRKEGLLPELEVEVIIATTPAEILSYQAGFAEAKTRGALEEFIERNRSLDYRHVAKEAA